MKLKHWAWGWGWGELQRFICEKMWLRRCNTEADLEARRCLCRAGACFPRWGMLSSCSHAGLWRAGVTVCTVALPESVFCGSGRHKLPRYKLCRTEVPAQVTCGTGVSESPPSGLKAAAPAPASGAGEKGREVLCVLVKSTSKSHGLGSSPTLAKLLIGKVLGC